MVTLHPVDVMVFHASSGTYAVSVTLLVSLNPDGSEGESIQFGSLVLSYTVFPFASLQTICTLDNEYPLRAFTALLTVPVFVTVVCPYWPVSALPMTVPTSPSLTCGCSEF